MMWVLNARQLYLKLWSNRLMILAAILSGLEAGIQFYLGGDAWTAAIVCGISIAATIARMIPQPQAQARAARSAERRKADRRAGPQ